MRLSIESLLLDSDDRAAQVGKRAYLHLVGLGLGVWMYTPAQKEWYVEVVTECLQQLVLNHVSTVEVAWVEASKRRIDLCVVTGKAFGIKVLFNKRPPCARLDTDELLVRSWAWDSNTLPGSYSREFRWKAADQSR